VAGVTDPEAEEGQLAVEGGAIHKSCVQEKRRESSVGSIVLASMPAMRGLWSRSTSLKDCKANTYIARATMPNCHTLHDHYNLATPASVPTSMFVSAHAIVPVHIVLPVSLCPHCSLLVLSLCVLWLASPVYNLVDLVSYHKSIHLSPCCSQTPFV